MSNNIISLKNSAAAIIGFQSLTLITLLSKESLSIPLVLSVCFIAISLPNLFFTVFIESCNNKTEINEQFHHATVGAAVVFSMCFFSSLFWHFSFIASLIFIATTVISAYFSNIYITKKDNE